MAKIILFFYKHFGFSLEGLKYSAKVMMILNQYPLICDKQTPFFSVLHIELLLPSPVFLCNLPKSFMLCLSPKSYSVLLALLLYNSFHNNIT